MSDETSYAIGEVAANTGVTVRTLRHYHEIGLLVPSARTRAGYRRYVRCDVERLYRILVYRELGFDLAGIAAILDDPAAETLEHLRRQRTLLQVRVERLQRMLKGVETMMDSKNSGYNMTVEEMREVFGDFDPSNHAAEVEARWGDSEAYRQSQRRTAKYAKADWMRIRTEIEAIDESLAAAKREDLAPTSDTVMAIAERHREHISRWFYDCSPEFHRGLGEMYVADPRFAAHYDDREPGLSGYFRDAILANAARQTRV